MAEDSIPKSKEIWKTIPEFPDYTISSQGRVRRAVDCRTHKAGRLLRPGWNERGYFYVMLRQNNSVSKKKWIHRLVLEVFKGPPPTPVHCALHRDDNNRNNTPRNLRWGTKKENSADRKMNKGWHDLKGELNGAAKLNEEQVIEIRRLFSIGVCGACIGRIYKLDRTSAYRIRDRKNWKHL